MQMVDQNHLGIDGLWAVQKEWIFLYSAARVCAPRSPSTRSSPSASPRQANRPAPSFVLPVRSSLCSLTQEEDL